VVSIASTVSLSEEDDEMVWQFHSPGVYSHSLYKVINFRGVALVYLPAVWKLSIPPRIHFFMVSF
jgi:hypothetical protein